MLKNNKGMTLIEVVVAFAIIAVVSVVIVIGFRTMGGILNEGSSVSNLDQELEQKVATSDKTTPSGGAITGTIKIKGPNGEVIKELDGEIQEYTDKEESQSFRIFEADPNE